MTSTRTVARFSSVLLSALSTGGFFRHLDQPGPLDPTVHPATYVEVQQATIRNLRPVMGTLLPTAIAANAITVALEARHPRSSAFALPVGGLCAHLVALLLTATIELPINARVLTWSPAQPPQGWETVRDRWARVHTARTASAVAGLVCVAAAAALTSPTERHTGRP